MRRTNKSKNKINALVQIGDNIRTHRKARSVSQENLALMAGLDRSYVGSIERGERNITVSTLLILANALKTSAQELLEGL